MAENPKEITHEGRVVGISGDMVDVLIESSPACGACKVRSACGAEEGRDIIISIETPRSVLYSVGEEVIVSIKRVMGIKAIFYAYILPFLFVLIPLVIMLRSGLGELVSGLISLATLVIYYFLLYLLRNFIEKDINFDIEKKCQ